MARYGGGHEDLDREIQQLREIQEQVQSLNAKEIEAAQATRQGNQAREEAARRQRELAAAQREAAGAAEREAAVRDVEARNLDVSTAAIERNRAARERLAAAETRSAALARGAFGGARDPRFGEAFALGGADVTQYRIRREMAVGQQRAARLQAAAVAGIRPGDAGPANRPFTRSFAAEVGLERSQAELTQANRELANARRRKSATDDERADLLSRRNAARQSVDAANLELQSARRDEATAAERAAAQRQESAVRREAAAKEAAVAGRGPGTDIIRHPTEFGRRVPGPFGGYSAAAGGAGRPGVIAEGGAVGGGRPFAGPVIGGFPAPPPQAAMNDYLRSLGEVGRQQHELIEQRADRYLNSISAASRRSAAGLQESAVNFGMASQAMTRHGALSSEFIAAAARGETTVRELGNQALVTAGKFGGWLAVGSAIYLVADAARNLGTGAIQGASGVDQLGRILDDVDADKAIGDFARLAGDFNVPVEESADAVYRMAQVFHDQEEATKAAEAALYAYQTGGVAVEEGTASLISITQAFGLTADDLVTTFDQINEAQNRFGATIPDIMAGLAKSGGVYRQAGGDLDYLLAVMVAIQRQTRRSGQEIGTGIARGVNQFALPSHQEALRAQGVDVDPQNFQSTLQSAMRAARRPGADINEIARGLLGNQYARLLAPVLADQSVLERAQKETAPDQARGSAARELRNVLNEARQQIVAIGVHLQEIGAELARAGVFDIFFAGIRATNGMLGAAGDLLHLFNQLPTPVRHMVTLLAEGYIILQAMRRLGATEALAGGPLGFLSGGDQRVATRVRRSYRDEVDASRNESERYSRGAYRARLAAQIATEEAASFAPTVDRARGMEASEQRTRVLQKGIMLDHAAAEARTRAQLADNEAAASARVLTRAEQDLARVRAMSAAELRALALSGERAIPADMSRPTGERAMRFGPATAAAVANPALARIGPMTRAEALAVEAQRLSTGATEQQQRLRSLAQEQNGLSTRAARFQQTAQDFVGRHEATANRLGVAGRAGVSAANRSISALARGGTFVGRAGEAMSRLPSAIGGFARMLGPLDAALLGIVGLGLAMDAIRRQNERANDFIGQVNRQGQSSGAHQRLIQEARRRADRERSTASSLNPANSPLGLLLGSPFNEGNAAAREAAETEIAMDRRIREEQRRAQRAGRPRANMFAEDLIRDIDRDAQLRRDNLISQSEFDRRMARHAVEVQTLRSPSRVQLVLARGAMADALRDQGDEQDYRQVLKGLPEAQLDQQMKLLESSADTFGPRTGTMTRMRALYGEAVARWGSRTNDPEAMRALAESREEFFGQVERLAKSEVDRGLSLADSEGDRRGAYRRGLQLIRRNITGNARNRLDQAEDRLGGVREEIEGADPRDRAGMDALLERQRTLLRVRRRARRELSAAERRAQLLIREMQRAAFEDREQGRSVNLALNQARDVDPTDQAAAAVRSARASVRDAGATFGRKSREYRQALTQLYSARNQAAQAALGHIRAENALLSAQAGNDPAAQARAGVAGAQRLLAEMSGSNRDRYSDDDRTQALADLISAQNQQAEQVAEDAQRMAELQGQIAAARAGDDPVAQARAALAAARAQMATANTPVERAEALLSTIQANNQLESALADREAARQRMLASAFDDPVRAAHAETVAARRAVRRATPGTQGYYEARTRLNEAQRSEVQARIDDTADDIDFDRTMGRIDVSTAIERYESMLRIRNLSKRQRRQILRAIQGLKDEAESQSQGFNMNVDNLKLPTAYDVRRAFDPIREQVRASARMQVDSSMSTMYDQRAQVNANVNVYVNESADADRVYEALDRVLTTTVRSKARSARRRG